MAAIPLLGGIGLPELLIVLVVVLLLFGPKRLPQLGKSLGKTVKAIREGVEGSEEDEEKPAAAASKKDAAVDAEDDEE